MLNGLLLLSSLTLLSCGQFVIADSDLKVTQKAKFPNKSFVKIYKTLHILECSEPDPKKTKCKKGDSFTSIGSGISIGSTNNGKGSIILTAGHVCAIEVSDYTKKLVKNYKVTISAQNIENEISQSEIILSVDDNKIDLCMLHSPHLKTEGVALATQPPKVGDILMSLSAPAGIFHPPTFAILSGRYSGIIDSEQKIAMITIPAVGGSSGSGIINEDMELVGILFATHPGFNNVSLSSSYILMMQFIHEGFQIFLNSKN